MSRVISQEHSEVGDGQNRTTYHYDNGATRDITERADGGLTITDTDSQGNSVSGDGARGPMGGYARVNEYDDGDDDDDDDYY